MEEKTREEIRRLKESIYRKKEEIGSINRLVNREIDREFPTDLWELSDRELDHEMGDRLSFLNQDIDPRPRKDAVTSHRKILGKPIVLLKRGLMKMAGLYTNLLLERQQAFNQQAVAFHLATFIRLRRIEKGMQDIKEKLKEIEEEQDIILDRMEHLQARVKGEPREQGGEIG